MRSRVWLGALLTLLVAALVLPAAAAAKNKPADTVFKNGYIYTVNPGARVAQAVAVMDGKIVYVGSNQGANAFVGPSTKVVKLDGKMMLPGFIDSHTHSSFTGRMLFSVVLNGLNGTLESYLSDIAAFAAANPDAPAIRGSGWSNTVIADIGPLASDLDTVVPDKPASIMSEDGHSYWVNTKALELAGIDGSTPDPAGGKIERLPGTVSAANPYGVPSGTLRESAADLVNNKLPDYSVGQYRQGILYYQSEVAGPLGITSMFDPLLKVGSNVVQAYEELAQEGLLTVRVRGALALDPSDDLNTWLPTAVAERAKHTTPMFRINAVKVFADGVVEGHTAFLNEPYADALAYAGDADYRGDPLWTPEAMAAAFTALDKAGFQIHVHAIGDAATSEVLDALTAARKANGPHDWRPGITHVQLVDPSDYKRFAKLGVTAVPDPYWFEKDDYYTYIQVPYLGLPRADHEYPMKSFFDNKVLVASASDFPVTAPPNPLWGIGAGVTRWFPWGLVHDYPAWPDPSGMLWPEEAVTVDQMVRSFTTNGAAAYSLEKTTGTIQVGKSADLIVLDQNLFEISPDQIFDASVLFTMSHGAVLHDAL